MPPKKVSEFIISEYDKYLHSNIASIEQLSSMPTKDDYVKECIRKDAYNEDELAATFYYEIMI